MQRRLPKSTAGTITRHRGAMGTSARALHDNRFEASPLRLLTMMLLRIEIFNF